MKHRGFLVAFVLLVLVVLGFGFYDRFGAAPRPAVVASSVDAALDGLPREASLIGGVDVPHLAASPSGARIAQLVTARLVESCRFGADRPGALVFGGDMSFAEGKTWGGLLAGPMLESAVERCLEAVLAPASSVVVKETVAGRTTYHGDERAPDPNPWLALTADGKLAIAGERAWLGHMLDSSSPRARQNQALVEQTRFVDQKAAVWAVGLLTDGQRKQLEQLAEGKLESAPSTIRVTGHFSDQATVEIAAAFENPRLALQAVVLVKGVLLTWQQTGKDQPWVILLDHVEVTVKGSEAVVRVGLDEKDVDYIADPLERGVTVAPLPSW